MVKALNSSQKVVSSSPVSSRKVFRFMSAALEAIIYRSIAGGLVVKAFDSVLTRN